MNNQPVWTTDSPVKDGLYWFRYRDQDGQQMSEPQILCVQGKWAYNNDCFSYNLDITRGEWQPVQPPRDSYANTDKENTH